jgi:hypothetical protein
VAVDCSREGGAPGAGQASDEYLGAQQIGTHYDTPIEQGVRGCHVLPACRQRAIHCSQVAVRQQDAIVGAGRLKNGRLFGACLLSLRRRNTFLGALETREQLPGGEQRLLDADVGPEIGKRRRVIQRVDVKVTFGEALLVQEV